MSVTGFVVSLCSDADFEARLLFSFLLSILFQ